MQASIAERFAYGTPLDPVDADAHIQNVPRTATAFVARVLLSALFIIAGVAKLTDPGGAVAYMNKVGIPHADVLVYVAGCAELLGGLSMLLGFLARLGALGLFIYMIPVVFFFHDFWNVTGAEAKAQMVQFTKDIAIMGALLLMFADGPGRFSIDERMRRPMTP